MHLRTNVALALVGCLVPVVLCSGGAPTTGYHGDVKNTEDICSPFEVLKPVEPCCEPTCDDDCSHAICRRAPNAVAKPSCVCRQGYVRHKGCCIQKEACPAPYKQPKPNVNYESYSSYLPVPLAKSGGNVQQKCSQNEVLAYCRPHCEPTCDKDCSGVVAPKVCIPEPSCVCKEPFVRHNGRCIAKCDCPRKNPLLKRPLSDEYIDFEVVSLEGMKSDEDYDYSQLQPSGAGADGYKKQAHFGGFPSKKIPMMPAYMRNNPKPSGTCGCKGSTTEKPALFPPVCACRGKQQTQTPTYAPKLDENVSYESTEEDCDIVPYVPPLPTTTRAYPPRPAAPLFPPSARPVSGPFYVPRKTVSAQPVHGVDRHEPVDHFFGSGQATSDQQNSAGQEEYRKPITIWPPVTCSCKRCGLNRKQR